VERVPKTGPQGRRFLPPFHRYVDLSAGRFFLIFPLFRQAGAAGWPACWLAPGRHTVYAASAALFVWAIEPSRLGAEKARNGHAVYTINTVNGPEKGI
jgi:hypothetical protein